MKKTLLIVLLFAIVTHSYAQTPNIKFDHIGVKEGLPEAQVHVIKQDAEGYIWIGTQNGLVRYDGYNYKIYQLGSEKLNKQINTNIKTIFVDRKGILWVSVISNGIFRYERNTDSFTQFVYPKQIDELYIDFEDNANNLWFKAATQSEITLAAKFNTTAGKFELFGHEYRGTDHINSKLLNDPFCTNDGTPWIPTENGLLKYNGEGKGFTAYLTNADTAKARCFNPVYEAPSQPGILWANTFHGNNIDLKVTRFDYRNNTSKDYVPGKKPGDLANALISSIYEDKKKQLWFSLDKGVAKLDRATGLFTNYLQKDSVTNEFSDFLETSKGNFWLSNYKGVAYFNTVTGQIKNYSDADAPKFSYSKIIDNTGQLWVSYNGVYKTNYLKSAFHIFKPIPGKPDSYPGGSAIIAKADNGNYWLCINNIIYQWNTKVNQFKSFINTKAISCYGICQVSNDLIYVSSTKGLIAYNIKTKKQEPVTNNPADNAFLRNDIFYSIYRAHDDIIWIGSYRNGISSFDPKTKRLTKYPFRIGNGLGDDNNDGKLDDHTVLCIYEDREGTIWIGTNNGGLNKFDRTTGKFRSYHTKKNQKMFVVTAIHEDHAGRFWVGTYLNGMFEFDRKNGNIIKSVNEQSGILHNEISNIDEDTTGHLMLISERGITRYYPETDKIQNFDANTILPGEDIALDFQTQGSKNFARSIVVALKNGVMQFDPQSLDVNPTPPIVHIAGITYSDPLSDDSSKTIIPYGVKTLELAYNQNRIQFNYIALHFDDPSQNKYAYKLDGYDKDYVQAGTLRSVTYTNLSPGTYTFHVIASNADGVWNNTGASITIIIHTSLWMRWWAWLIYIVLFAAAIYGFIAYRSRALKQENQLLEEKINDRTKQLTNANKSLSEQQEEITIQRDRLAETVNELKTTQQQLVQSEKLASLGELTAGIAHEIQNPLNFVNNFSEVSVELIDEMQEELRNGDKDEAIEISESIKENLEKIRHHGKRADGIVKNMLQHSRSNSGEKEPTDINKLADEYLRLSYHGLRAKDKSFNSDMATEFDEKVQKLNVIPQDIGRVLLNLFNNAFYAVQQKKKTAPADYKPLVTIVTASKGKYVEIKVTDNGVGMPDTVKEKILLPFFTTKPTGEGTGLGLSMSYDIVVKGHGGKLEVNTKEGEFTEFIVYLPVQAI